MGPDEARRVDAMLRTLDIAGVVAPEDPEHPAGAWRVYDQAEPSGRRDITGEVLAAVARHHQPSVPQTRQGPMRGFVIPPKNAA